MLWTAVGTTAPASLEWSDKSSRKDGNVRQRGRETQGGRSKVQTLASPFSALCAAVCPLASDRREPANLPIARSAAAIRVSVRVCVCVRAGNVFGRGRPWGWALADIDGRTHHAQPRKCSQQHRSAHKRRIGSMRCHEWSFFSIRWPLG